MKAKRRGTRVLGRGVVPKREEKKNLGQKRLSYSLNTALKSETFKYKLCLKWCGFMTQTENSSQSPQPQKKSSAVKWIAVIIIIVVIVSAIAYIATRPTTPTPTHKNGPLSVSPSATAIYTTSGAPITFSPGIPSGSSFTKVVWNFGNGVSQNTTGGTGQVTYTYNTPGNYLVSVTAYNSTGGVVNSNQTLIPVTVTTGPDANIAAVYGPIEIMANSANNVNQTIAAGGWVNMTFGGTQAAVPIGVGSPVPGDTNYLITGYEWSVDNTSLSVSNTTATINETFSAGIHYVTLTVTSAYNGQTASGQYIVTIAAGNYQVKKVTTKISPNKNEILDATWIPGGPRTFDPSIAYDTVSYEAIYEVYQPLVYYSGISTALYNPVIAKNVPTFQNGGITGNQTSGALNYTFYINTSLKFSNGDSVNAYDVYVSMARALLFANDAGSPGWLLAHAVLPGYSLYGPFNNSFYWVHHAVTWNNATQSVTFHLLPTIPENNSMSPGLPVQNFGAGTYFLQLISGPTIGRIMDYNVLKANGAAPQNTTASYAQFANTTSGPGVEGYWNQYMEFNMIGTGPYELKLFEPNQEIIFMKNPYYQQTPGLLAPSALVPEVVIEYLTNEATAQQAFATGSAQFAEGAYPVSDTAALLNLVNQGIVSTTSVAQLSVFSLYFNMQVNVTGMQGYDKQANIPSYFFADLNVRKAFSYAFNYSYWIDQAWSADGIAFAENITGVIPRGMLEYPSNISTQYPETTNYALAKYYWSQSQFATGANASKKWYIPLFNSQGVPEVDQMYSEYGSYLSQISNGQIVTTIVDVSFAAIVGNTLVTAGANPMPLYFLGWIDDYPDASDFVAPFYEPGGSYSLPDGLYAQNPGFNASQAAMVTEMQDLLVNASETTNVTLSTDLYYKAEVIATQQLFLYVGTFQSLGLFAYSTEINPAGLAQTYNPAVGGSFIIFYTVQYNT